jgi:hypothetical protein
MSPGELEIIFKTSDVAVCCSSASSRSRMSSAIVSVVSTTEELRRRATFAELRRFNILWRRVFVALPALSRRLITAPEAQDEPS